MKKYLVLLIPSFICQLSNAQNETIVAHEWGTFTARYSDLGIPYSDMHQRVEEPLPAFVKSINYNDTTTSYTWNYKNYFTTYNGKDLKLLNTFIKMETPVIYFYADHAVNDLGVSVKFHQGSVSQFYPLPVKFEGYSNLSKYVTFKNCDYGYGESPDGAFLCFNNYHGFADWKINILNKKSEQLCTRLDSIPPIWEAPRKTKSNLVEYNGEKEKYIFYRGLAGFQNPIIPVYTKNGELEIQNVLSVPIEYVLIYEKKENGNINIWDITSLKSNDRKVVKNKNIVLNESEWNNSLQKDFINQLTKNGLYEDEAIAMLETWKKSYFDSKGLRVFYIVPRSFTDSILPLTFTKTIADLQRVMVGRTEIDAFDQNNLSAYSNSVSINEIIMDSVYILFPNPSSGDVFLRSHKTTTENTKISMVNSEGKVLSTFSQKIYPLVDNKLNINTCISKPGKYYFKIQSTKINKTFAVIFQ